jgi:hypothetical protein
VVPGPAAGAALLLRQTPAAQDSAAELAGDVRLPAAGSPKGPADELAASAADAIPEVFVAPARAASQHRAAVEKRYGLARRAGLVASKQAACAAADLVVAAVPGPVAVLPELAAGAPAVFAAPRE